MTDMPLYPMLFTPVYKDYLWGGHKIADRYDREGTPTPCAESWELADREEGMSVVSNGPLKGTSLQTLVSRFGEVLIGSNDPNAQTFPLLIKIIDAEKALSVQVHPNNQNAALTGGEPKTEMWYVLEADANAVIFAGLQPGATPESFNKALKQKTLKQDVLAAIPAQSGRAVFVPGGRVHAIGAGCMLLEIQQNSNTTYRVYDWDRTDKQGNGRELHLEQAMTVIDWEHATPEVKSPLPHEIGQENQAYAIMTCDYFKTTGYNLKSPLDIKLDGSSFHALFTAKGKVLIGAGDIVTMATTGTTALVPAHASGYTLTPLDGPANVIQITT